MSNPCQNCGGETIEDVAKAMSSDRGVPLRFRWRPLHDPSRLQAVLDGWAGTPYMAGQRVRGVGVDCVQLIAGILDDLYLRTKPTRVPRLPSDCAIHNARNGFSTIINLRKAFPSTVVREKIIEPGDIIVVRATHDIHGPRRPGHVLITGSRQHTALHATPGTGVCWTSIQTLDVLRVYRPQGKEKWVS